MAKLSAKYEAVYIIDPRKNEEETAALVERFKALAETHATEIEIDEWGKRKLAYLIQDQTEGYYVRMTFTSGNAFPAELDRIFRITDGVMRSIIVCLDE